MDGEGIVQIMLELALFGKDSEVDGNDWGEDNINVDAGENKPGGN